MTESLRQHIESIIVPSFEGWCPIDKALSLAETILDIQALRVVEIGVFGGRSIVPQALALKELEETTRRHGWIYGIDPWKLEAAIEGHGGDANEQWYREKVDLHAIHRYCMEKIWSLGLEHWTLVLRAFSSQPAHLFASGSIDLLHIDGCHSEVSSCRDVETWLPLVRRGGYIFFDDIDWTTTAKAHGMLDSACETVRDIGTCRVYKKPDLRRPL